MAQHVILIYVFHSFKHGNEFDFIDAVLLVFGLFNIYSDVKSLKKTKTKEVKNPGNVIYFKIFISFILFLFVGYKILNSGQKPIFKEQDKDFKVLVLPFKQLCQYEGGSFDAGYVINDRLNKKNLNIKSYYLDSLNVNNLNLDYINGLQEFHNSDMIVYGQLFTEDCSKDEDKICLNFKLKENSILKGKFDKIDDDFREGGIRELMDGQIQKSMEDIILLLTVVGQLKNTTDEVFQKNIDQILLNVPIENVGTSLNLMGDLFYNLGYLGSASALYLHAQSLFSENNIDWSFFESIQKVNNVLDQYGLTEKTLDEIINHLRLIKKKYLLILGEDTLTDERFILAYTIAAKDLMKLKEYEIANNYLDTAFQYLLKYEFRRNLYKKMDIYLLKAECNFYLGNIERSTVELNKLNFIKEKELEDIEIASILKGHLLYSAIYLKENNYKRAKEKLKLLEYFFIDNYYFINNIQLIQIKVTTYDKIHQYFLGINQENNAIKALKFALKTQTSLLSRDSTNYIFVFKLAELNTKLAIVYKRLKNLQQEEYYNYQAVSVFRAFHKTTNGFGRIEFDYVCSLYNLANSKYRYYKDTEAIVLLQEADRYIETIKSRNDFMKNYRNDVDSLEMFIANLKDSLKYVHH